MRDAKADAAAVEGIVLKRQMLKGTLRRVLLMMLKVSNHFTGSAVSWLEADGFGIVSKEIVYEVFLELEREGCVTSYYEEGPTGLQRRFFALGGDNERTHAM